MTRKPSSYGPLPDGGRRIEAAFVKAALVKLYPNRNCGHYPLLDHYRLNRRYVSRLRALWLAVRGILIVNRPGPLLLLDNFGITKADVEAAIRRDRECRP